MIPWLENCGEELVIILSPTGQDQVAPGVLSALVGVIIGKLQSGVAYAVVQACSSWFVVGIKVVWLHIPHIAGGVDEAIWQICGNRHGAPIVADKEAKGTPLTVIAPGLKSVPHHLEVNLYVLDEV